MSQNNSEIVRTMYASWKEGNFAAGAADLDPHVTFIVRPPFPESGVFHGPGGVSDYMAGFLENWERYTVDAEHLQAVGDTVLVRIHQRGIGKASGVETEGRFFMLFTFRGPKIVRIENMLTEAEALEALGLSE